MSGKSCGRNIRMVELYILATDGKIYRTFSHRSGSFILLGRPLKSKSFILPPPPVGQEVMFTDPTHQKENIAERR